jgi:hypothetical protein
VPKARSHACAKRDPNGLSALYSATRIADSNSRNAVNLSSARATKRFPCRGVRQQQRRPIKHRMTYCSRARSNNLS